RGRARALAAWREREARRRDRPRSFVLSDGALVELARRRPHNDRALAAVPGVRRADVSRHSAAWRALFDEVDALPDAALPDRRQTIDLRPYSRIVDQLRRRVKARAKELDLPAPLLAPRRVVEGLVRHALRAQEAADDDAADALPSARRGWRREAIGDALYAEAVALLDGFEPDAGARTR
ncbi:MAG: HRDC domain-containing protein, partial [Acidobacteriota bacterium]